MEYVLSNYLPTYVGSGMESNYRSTYGYGVLRYLGNIYETSKGTLY